MLRPEPGAGGVSLDNAMTMTPTTFWMRGVFNMFRFVGRIVCTFPAASSNLERTNKINAVIHCPERACLSDASVRMATRGYIAIRAQAKAKMPPITRPSLEEWFAKFDEVSDQDEAAVKAFYELMLETEKAIEAAVAEASTTAGINANRGVNAVGDDDDVGVGGGSGVVGAMARHAEDAPAPLDEDTRRSSRRRRTGRYEEAMKTLAEDD